MAVLLGSGQVTNATANGSASVILQPAGNYFISSVVINLNFAIFPGGAAVELVLKSGAVAWFDVFYQFIAPGATERNLAVFAFQPSLILPRGNNVSVQTNNTNMTVSVAAYNVYGDVLL